MDATRFDRLAQSFAAAGPRREVLRRLALLPLLAPLAAWLAAQVEAAQRRRRTVRRRDRVHNSKKSKKKKCAKAGQPTNKKRKKCCQGLVKDASGRCAQPAPVPPTPPCVPSACPINSCGSHPDGCGGTLNCGGCPAGKMCPPIGFCQPCTVTCTGTPVACGAALELAMIGGGTVYVCPGRYQRNFTIDNFVRVIGAGDGDDPASNTILDAGGVGRVLRINPLVSTVELERLRFTNGNMSSDLGGGILNGAINLHMTDCTVSGNTTDDRGGGIAAGGNLKMTRCTVRDNHATVPSGHGGGIWLNGITTLTDCLVEANDAAGGGGLWNVGTTMLAGSTQVRGNTANDGGGIYVEFGTLVIAETCRVMGNTAGGLGNGGGIWNNGGTVTLQGADPSPIVVDNCLENCAGPVAVNGCSTEPPVSC